MLEVHVPQTFKSILPLSVTVIYLLLPSGTISTDVRRCSQICQAVLQSLRALWTYVSGYHPVSAASFCQVCGWCAAVRSPPEFMSDIAPVCGFVDQFRERHACNSECNQDITRTSREFHDDHTIWYVWGEAERIRSINKSIIAPKSW